MSGEGTEAEPGGRRVAATPHRRSRRSTSMTLYFGRGNRRAENLRRALVLGLPGARIAPGASLRLGEAAKVGSNVHIGLCCYINGNVEIGDDCIVGPYCCLTSNTHLFCVATQSFQGRNRDRPIVIGRGSWLCAGVTITAGVRLGACSLVCAGAVVCKSAPDYAILAGVPAIVVGRVDAATGACLWNKGGGVGRRELP